MAQTKVPPARSVLEKPKDANNNNEKTVMLSMYSPPMEKKPGAPDAFDRMAPPVPMPQKPAGERSVMQPPVTGDKSVMQKPGDKSVMQSTMNTVSVAPTLPPGAPAPPGANTAAKKKRRKRRKKNGATVSVDETTDTTTTRTACDEEEIKDPAEQLKQELSCGPPFKRVTFDFDYEGGQYLGMKLSPNLIVLQVDQRPGISPFWDKVRPGDVLRSVNQRYLKTLDLFYQLLRKCPSPMTLALERPIRFKPVSNNRIKRLSIDLECGDRFFTAYLFYRPTAKLGISVKGAEGMVALLKVDEEGLGAGAYDIGDVILDVDGVPVKTTDEAKILILKALEKRGFVSTVIMRPMTEKTLNRTRQILGASGNATEDPDMRIDAVLIGRTEAMRRKLDKSRVQPKKGVLVKPGTFRPKQVKLAATVDQQRNKVDDIWSDVEDNEWNELQSVPTREEETEAATKPEKFKKLKLLFTKFTGNKD